MANDYTLWSEALELSQKPSARITEEAWIRSVLRSSDEYDEESDVSATVSAHLNKMGINAQEAQAEYWPDFEWKIEKDYLWVYSEESGNLDNLALFVQGFLAKFDPEGTFQIEWASTCSAPRIGSFGGGVLVVTAKQIRAISTAQMASKLVEEARQDLS